LKPKGSKVYESFEMTPELRSNKSWNQRDPVQVDIPRSPHHCQSDCLRHRAAYQEKRVTKIYVLCQDTIAREMKKKETVPSTVFFQYQQPMLLIIQERRSRNARVQNLISSKRITTLANSLGSYEPFECLLYDTIDTGRKLY
jgi:hypothetical protein